MPGGRGCADAPAVLLQIEIVRALGGCASFVRFQFMHKKEAGDKNGSHAADITCGAIPPQESSSPGPVRLRHTPATMFVREIVRPFSTFVPS